MRAYLKSNRFARAAIALLREAQRRTRPPKYEKLFRAQAELWRVVEGGTLVVGIPSLGGSFEIGSQSDLLRRILVFGEYEPNIVEIFKKYVDPRRDAIDVGANIGLLTVLLARLVSPPGRVLAVEPTPGALSHLRANLQRNALADRVALFEGVASHAPGHLGLNIVEGKEEYSTLTASVHPSVQERRMVRLEVAAETIDRLVERFRLNPGFIKIDTEGAEYDTLLGCENTMTVYRPAILYESWPAEWKMDDASRRHDVASLLTSRNYSSTRIADDQCLALPQDQRA